MKHGCKLAHIAAGVLGGSLISIAAAAPLNIANVPLFLPGAVSPLNMLVLGRDHKLYYEAYNDRSDLNGGGLDVGYKPAIEYFGYFDSRKCYTHDGTKFVPQSVTADKTCSGQWSGDWLNWATTARIDALNKVLFGGFRRTDDATQTVLERSHIPHDAHSWVKEYRSAADDGYDIADYTPLSAPTTGLTHLFANVSLMRTNSWTSNDSVASPPLLRVAQNVAGANNRAWNWASTESPVAGACYGRDGGNDGKCAGATSDSGTGQPLSANTTAFNDLPVRVEVCVAAMLESNCRRYPSGNYKPIGLLQEYGENDAMRFGLLTGSYQKSKSGGVLRKEIGELDDEINIETDGTFKNFNGIISTLSKLRAAGYRNYRGGSSVTWYGDAGRGAGVAYTTSPLTSPPSGDILIANRAFSEPEFGGMWGNPVGEMMYEALRYFSGEASPTSAFDYGTGTTIDSTLELPRDAAWSNPYSDSSLSCAKPFMTVISDINTSYDTDQLPGKSFTGTAPTDDLGGLDVSDEADTIWSNELGGSREIFIGDNGTVADGAPSPKTATSFATIRGLSPEEPTKEGGYYAASVAKYGYENDLNAATGEQEVQTFAVALASPLPRIEIPVGGRTVTLVPFAKSVGGAGSISSAPGAFQPTNQIVDFYVETMAADSSSGSFLINFEDVEAGNDHDMDAVVRYTFAVVSGQVQVNVTTLYQQGGIVHHMGYTISGTTADGTYLVVQDDGSNIPYFVDTPAGVSPGGCANGCTRPVGVALPLTDSRLFTPGTGTTATLLKDPLWYAAKWGGFRDANANGRPDVQSEWDDDNDGNPDNYFLVTNALTLGDELRSAFDLILSRTASAAAVATNTTRLDTNTLIYQAQFRSDDWTGNLLAYRLLGDGTLGSLQWSAGLPAHGSRAIFTRDGAIPGAADGVPFEWDEIGTTHQAALNERADGTQDPTEAIGQNRVAWLRGDAAQEQGKGGTFRPRSTPLGDIINSDPQFVGAQNFGYESLPTGTPGRETYQTFRRTKINTTTGAVLEPMVYVGANDGMLHGFDAATGIEHFAYVPSTLIPELEQLTDPSYAHRYFVDGQIVVGDAYLDRGGASEEWTTVLVGTTGAGGKTVFALDVTDPHAFEDSDVLWEFTDPELGNPIGQPVIARMANGQWAAVFANGYNSTSETAQLFIVDLENGELIAKIDTGVGVGNGLATPSLLADGTRTIIAAYAGDLAGNLWKFDLSSADADAWDVAFGGSPLFTATDDDGLPQPITAPPEIGRHPDGGFMIYFGTGKFFETGDNVVDAMPPVHTFYGLWDKTSAPSAITYTAMDRDEVLTRQEILFEDELAADGTPIDEDGDPIAGRNFPVRVTSNTPTNWATGARGWFIDLVSPVHGAEGERVVSLPLLRNDRVIFPTLVPSSSPCEFGGGSWLMELAAVNGTRLEVPPLDINEDGVIDSDDLVTVNIGGVMTTVAPSAILSGENIIDTPAVIVTPDGEDVKVASGTSGGVEAVRESGTGQRLRGSWRQLR